MKKQTELSERQRKAIEAIAAKGGASKAAQARAAGVPKQTYDNWLQRPYFSQALSEALQVRIEEVTSRQREQWLHWLKH